jgi:hypothetical protein
MHDLEVGEEEVAREREIAADLPHGLQLLLARRGFFLGQLAFRGMGALGKQNRKS